MRKFAFATVSLFLLLLIAVMDVQPAQAQATFSVSGAASTMTKIGYTELAGPVTFTVVSGTTVAGTIEFFLPNVILTATGGIALTGSGGLVTATLGAVVPEGGVVVINIPPGATAGSSATLSGVRVPAVGATFGTLTASVSSTNNSIFAGQNTIRVVNGFAEGMTLNLTGDATVSVVNNTIVSGPGTLQVIEGWTSAFSSAIGVAGQTAKTQVIVQVIGLPDNVSLTFPGVITSDNGDSATLVTPSSLDETLTNQSSANRVVYLFNDSLTSPNLLDSFSITPTVGITGAGSTGTAFIQVALGPIGAAVPNTEFPSTAVPRFTEVFLPPVSVPSSAVSTLFHPVPSSLSSESWSLSNTTSGGAVIIARARLEDGTVSTGVTNTVTINLPARQTTSVSLKDIFGTNGAPSGIAAVEFSSVNNGVVSNGVGSTANNRLSLVSTEQVITYLPFDRQTSTDVPALTVENTSNDDIPAQITLRSSVGASIVTVSRTVKARGALRESFSTLFSSASIPLDGYVIVRGLTGSLRSVLLNHPAGAAEAVPALTGTTNSPIVAPFFVYGAGYNTVLNLINASADVAVRVSVMPYSPAGVALASQPFIQTIAPTQRANMDFVSLFGQGGSVSSGYFTIILESSLAHLFSTPATVYGIARISTGGTTTDIPVVSEAGAQFFMTPVTETTSIYTGISMVNSTATPISVTMEAFSSAGVSLGTNTVNVPNGTARVQLLRELVPQFINQDGGFVRLSSNGNLRVVGFRGTFSGSELLYLRGETTP